MQPDDRQGAMLVARFVDPRDRVASGAAPNSGALGAVDYEGLALAVGDVGVHIRTLGPTRGNLG